MITVTENAYRQIKSSMGPGTDDTLVLRIAARKDTDGSFKYAMGFDELKPEDIVTNTDGVKIVYAPEMAELIEGMTIEFDTIDGGEKMFIFLNPNDPSYVPPTE